MAAILQGHMWSEQGFRGPQAWSQIPASHSVSLRLNFRLTNDFPSITDFKMPGWPRLLPTLLPPGRPFQPMVKPLNV